MDLPPRRRPRPVPPPPGERPPLPGPAWYGPARFGLAWLGPVRPGSPVRLGPVGPFRLGPDPSAATSLGPCGAGVAGGLRPWAGEYFLFVFFLFSFSLLLLPLLLLIVLLLLSSSSRPSAPPKFAADLTLIAVICGKRRRPADSGRLLLTRTSPPEFCCRFDVNGAGRLLLIWDGHNCLGTTCNCFLGGHSCAGRHRA